MKSCCLLLIASCLVAPSFQADRELNLNSWGRSSSSGQRSSQRCTTNQYQCRSGECISESYVCDGDRDCPGGEDERFCPAGGRGSGSSGSAFARRTTPSPDEETCTAQEFDCGRGGAGRYGRCIPNSPTFICDGVNDCTNGADERNCRATTTERPSRGSCKTGEFQCSSGRCLRPQWVCDGAEDCSDGEDERNCRTTSAWGRYTTSSTRRRSPSGSSSSRLRGTDEQLRPHYVNGLKVIASPRHQLWTKRANTKEQCGELCTERTKCKLVDYDKNSKSCTGYGEEAEVRFQFDEDHSSYGYWTETATRFEGVTFDGEDIQYQGQPIVDWLKITWTEQVCKQVCHIHPKCDLSIFNKKTNRCQLKHHARPQVRSTTNPNAVSILYGNEWDIRA